MQRTVGDHIAWIKEQIETEGGDASAYSKSEIVQQVDDSLMQLGKDESTAIANGH